MTYANSRKGLRRVVLASILMSSGCSSPQAIEGVVRPNPGEPLLERIPGPMPGFGPFEHFSDALLAACPRILSKPHATAGRVGSQDFQLRWRVSSEYCAWLYYTPEHQYELSMLTDQSSPEALNSRKSCVLPPVVDDRRYPPGSLKYVFALHNHPYTSTLSDYDIRFIVSKGDKDGFEVETRDGRIRLSIIAFFSDSDDTGHPTCDGFFQYIPLTGQLLKWTSAQGAWHCEQMATVRWSVTNDFRIEKRTAPCQSSTEGPP